MEIWKASNESVAVEIVNDSFEGLAMEVVDNFNESLIVEVVEDSFEGLGMEEVDDFYESVAVEVVEDSFEGLEIEEVDDSYEKCCSGGNGGFVLRSCDGGSRGLYWKCCNGGNGRFFEGPSMEEVKDSTEGAYKANDSLYQASEGVVVQKEYSIINLNKLPEDPLINLNKFLKKDNGTHFFISQVIHNSLFTIRA